MMKFNTIGLIGKVNHDETNVTLTQLHTWLSKEGYRILVARNIASELNINVNIATVDEIGEKCDLAIVVGGDGNMLGAARILAKYKIAVIGVNRGKLGFLTDLDPNNFTSTLAAVLDGNYIAEDRFLLETKIYRSGKILYSSLAVNEAVLHPDKIAHMIEFEIYIDDLFMYSQKADGMICSTPTGSTAYALSAGGAILTPNLAALILVPMFPHTLSCRPIVVDANSIIKLRVSGESDDCFIISCDGQTHLDVRPGDEIVISKSSCKLQLIHPKDHSYFRVLRRKLGWGSRLFPTSDD